MSIQELLSRTRDLGVRLWLDEDRVRFSAPQGALAPALRAELKARKQEIHAFLRQAVADRTETTGRAPIVPVPRSLAHPLSSSQQRLWFLDRLEGPSAAYNLPVGLRFSGPLCAVALARSLTRIVRRHEVLRTSFQESQDGDPVQVIAPASPLALPLVDLRTLPAGARSGSAESLAARELTRPFSLAEGPLLRALLLRVDETEHLLLLTLHHVVFDAWSAGVLMHELGKLYAAFVSSPEAEPALAELPVQYVDFAHWQRGWLRKEVLEAQIGYWRRKLEAVPVLDLPTDRPRPPVPSHRGRSFSMQLPSDLSAALAELGRFRGATLHMTLLAALEVLLSRLTGQKDFAVGTPVAGRNHPQLEGLIGFFVNTLALRSNLSQAGDDSGYLELLERVKRGALEAQDHQDLPFEQLVEELSLERDRSRSPLFQVLLSFESTARSGLGLDGLSVEPWTQDVRRAKFDLSLAAAETPDGLTVWFIYAADLLDASTVRRWTGHFRRLLRDVASTPEVRLDEIALLGPGERHQLLVEWNASPARGAAASPRPGVLARFEAQAEQRADTVAVGCAGTRLSYRELVARSERLGRHLRHLGVGPEDVVAVLDERGPELLTAMLAIFQAGGAYLPLDPLHPAGRLARIVEQAKSRLVLATEAFTEVVSEALAGLEEARRPEVRDPVRWLSMTAPPVAPGPRGPLAYVIFTSGSTGMPKGAMVEHRGMSNHLLMKVADLGLGPEDVVAQTASQCFDISVWQFLAALMVGGRVEVFPSEVAHDPARLADAMEDAATTVVETVPSLMTVLLQEIAERDAAAPSWKALRWLVPTGEALPPNLCREWFVRHPRVPLLNAYGPTECSDDVTHHVLTVPPDERQSSVPIGRPLANLRIYLLNGLWTVPSGVAGELVVAGVGVGRGYLHEARRTAPVFVPDPFAARPGRRSYRTGDLARTRADGVLEFLGRIDHQVKVRGFRIELGEIESVLARQPAVREVAVLLVEQGAARIVAFVVPEGGRLQLEELKSALRVQLPEYMVPQAFVDLESMPLTANGKLDRKALAGLSQSVQPSTEESAWETPETPLECFLAGLWSQSLGVERVGLHDDFFALGGHSISAAVLINRLQKALGEIVHVVAIFESPTVAKLAELVARGLPGSGGPALDGGVAAWRGQAGQIGAPGGKRDDRHVPGHGGAVGAASGRRCVKGTAGALRARAAALRLHPASGDAGRSSAALCAAGARAAALRHPRAAPRSVLGSGPFLPGRPGAGGHGAPGLWTTRSRIADRGA